MTDTHTTAHIPDEAVQAALDKCEKVDWVQGLFGTGLSGREIIESALTAAIPHLALSASPCSVEVTKLEWVQQDGKLAWDSSEYRIYVLLGSKPAVYRLLKASFGTQYAGDFVGVNALEAAKAAAQADFDRRTLSQIVTKPVDVPALLQEVRNGERDGFINTGKEPHGNDADLSCPCCGGSGHKDDAKPVDVAAVREQCAQIADNLAGEFMNDADTWTSEKMPSVASHSNSQAKAAYMVSSAIRALSAEPARGERLTGRISGCAALAQGGGE